MALVARLFLMTACLSLLTACSQASDEPHTLRGDIFGTFFEVTLGAQHADADLERIEAGVMATLNEVDRQMSTYRDDSALNRINRAPLQQEVAVDDELFFVLQRSETIAGQTRGRFDHTVGSLVNSWGFGPDGRVTERPSTELIEERLEQVGYHFLILNEDDQTALRTSDIFVDLSGIAKGYGVDAVSEYLLEQGVDNHLVNIGGDIRAQGQRDSTTHWRIGLEAPVEGRQVVRHILPIKNVALVGSGDYRNYFEHQGVRYSHTIDPTSGMPISHNLAAVTVISDNATDADGYSTAMMVMGPEEGLAFANRHDLAVLFITRESGEYNSLMSDKFEQEYAPQMRAPRVQ